MGRVKQLVGFIIGTIVGIISVGVMTVEHVFNPSKRYRGPDKPTDGRAAELFEVQRREDGGV